MGCEIPIFLIGGLCHKSCYRDNSRQCFLGANEHPAIDLDKHRVGVKLPNDTHGELVIIRSVR